MNWPLLILSCIAVLFVPFLIGRFFSWKTRRCINRELEITIQQIKDGTYESNAEPSPIQLSWDDNQITVMDSRTGTEVSICWQKVRSASAYKLDLLAHDQVCVAFVLNNDTSIEIDETMDGFCDLMEATPNYLPGFIAFSDWYMNITTPAFETNLTPLFVRSQD